MTGHEKAPTLGVVGGMGIYASIEFVKDCYKLFDVSNDSEKPRIILDVNTSIPGRSDYLLNNGPSPIEAIGNSIRGLINAGAEVIAIPCNTASVIVSSSYLPNEYRILNINEIVQREITIYSKNRRVLVLGSKGILDAQVYSKSIEESKGVNILLEDSTYEDLDRLIRTVKNFGFGTLSLGEMTTFMGKIIDNYKPDTLILGCTELFLPPSVSNSKIKVIDSRIELAREYRENFRGQNV